MNSLKRLSKVFETAEEILFDDSSRIVLMSDCHRGDGSWNDNFLNDQHLFFAALSHYYNEDYTYIEIGDGDELWENRRLSDIMDIHSDAFWLMSQFYNKGNLYMIYGNHDIVKMDDRFVENNLYQYFDDRSKKNVPLFKNIKLHEGLILKHRITGNRIFLIHGHQVDFLNSSLWRLSRFLVRHLWRPLEAIGVNNPSSTAKNYKRKDMVDNRLVEWVKKEKHMLIAGHTHRSMYPEVGDAPYFNDGSTIHPRCITAIEIAGGNITLVKWSVMPKPDSTLSVIREILAGPRKVKDYFNFKDLH